MASARDDFDRMRSVLADDFVIVDHRPLGFGAGDREYFIATSATRNEVSADGAMVNRSLEIAGRSLLVVSEAHRISDDGAEYVTVMCIVFEVDATDRIRRAEYFDEEQYDRAVARLHELGGPASAGSRPAIENDASAAIVLRLAYANSIDRDELANLDWGSGVAADVVRVDRRSIVSAPALDARADWEQNAAAFFEVFDTVTPEVVAVRGNSLTLIRLHCGREPDFVLQLLAIYEFDEHDDLAGRPTTTTRTSPPRSRSWTPATSQARVRSTRGCCGSAGRSPTRATGATSTRSSRCSRPTFVMDDRTRLGYGVGDREYFDRSSRSRADVAPTDGATINHLLRIVGNALLSVSEGHLITAEGSDYVWESCIVLAVDPSDRIHRAEYFDLDRYDEALARLHVLGAPAPTVPVPPVDNLAAQVERKLVERMRTADLADIADASGPRPELEDRRHLVNLGHLDAEGQVHNIALMREQGYVVEITEVVAVRGERLCLSRRVARTPGGDESPLLAVNELDADGHWVRTIFFDPDDLDAALDELEDRFVAGEGAAHEYAIRRRGDFRHACATRDLAAIEALVGADAVFVDHRPIGLPECDRAGWVALLAASVEQTPDMRMIERTLEIRGDVVMARTRRDGLTTEGFAYDWEQIAVAQSAAGLIRRIEIFPADDESAARARFEELAARPLTPYVDNAQIRVTARLRWQTLYGNVDPLSSYADDCVLVDRRSSVNAGEIRGAAEIAASIQSGIDVFGRLELEALAARGDRLALYRWAFVQDGGFATTALTVIESNEDLRTTRIESFDEHDLADAVDLLEARHAELQGDTRSWIDRIAAEGEHALNHRDFDAFEPLLAPGLTVVDHRQLGMSMDRDEYLRYLRVLIEQAPDFTFFFADFPRARERVDHRGAVLRYDARGQPLRVVVRPGDGRRSRHGASGRVRVLRRRPVGRGRRAFRAAGRGRRAGSPVASEHPEPENDGDPGRGRIPGPSCRRVTVERDPRVHCRRLPLRRPPLLRRVRAAPRASTRSSPRCVPTATSASASPPPRCSPSVASASCSRDRRTCPVRGTRASSCGSVSSTPTVGSCAPTCTTSATSPAPSPT